MKCGNVESTFLVAST